MVGNYDYDTSIETNELKQTFNTTSCEKNWVYTYYKNELCVIYDWCPLRICKIEENNQLSIIQQINMPKIFSYSRGSTCGFLYKKEIWFINHMVSYEIPRHYYHIISVFDIDMNLLYYSAPFTFEAEPIEYCLSIIVENERILINYSTFDKTTKIGIYEKKYIDALVKYKFTH
jgi:hypothetical protein